jgi:hypothetical protein
VFDVEYLVLDIFQKKTTRYHETYPASKSTNAKHQTLNIKYPTSKVKLTRTSVFDVGYLVLDIFQKKTTRYHETFAANKSTMQNIKH